METTLPDGVELALLHPRFAPGTLVALKTQISVDDYFAWARALPEDTASRVVVLEDAEGPFAMLVLHYSNVYHAIATDHWVIAKRKRGARGALQIGRIFVSYCREYARALGAKRVVVQTNRPQAIRRIADSAHTIEHVVCMEV